MSKPSNLSDAFSAIRNDYEMSRENQFQRRRTGLAPLGGTADYHYRSETKYYQCIKTGMLAYLNGYAPAVAVEFARKTLYSHERPTFKEIEEAVENAPKV